MLRSGTHGLVHARLLLYIELHPDSGFQVFEHVLQLILFPRSLYFSRQTPTHLLTANLTIFCGAFSGSYSPLNVDCVVNVPQAHNPVS